MKFECLKFFSWNMSSQQDKDTKFQNNHKFADATKRGSRARKRDKSAVDPSAEKGENQIEIKRIKTPDQKDEEGLTQDELTLVRSLRCNLLSQSCDKVTWKDVVGMEDIKEVLDDNLVLPFKHPDLFKGTKPIRGFLIYGPPGTGKTMIAKAVAAECNLTFLNCPSSLIISKYVGESAKLIRLLFKIARNRQPSIVYFDEIDSIGLKRGGHGTQSGHAQALTQLLTEIQGFGQSANVTVIGSTNCPWDIDDALMRRFEQRIYVPLPNEQQREALMKHSFKDRTLDIDESATLSSMAGFSADDIAKCCNTAMIEAAKRHIKKKCKDTPIITQADMSKALRKTKKSVSKCTVRKFIHYEKSVS